MRHGRHYTLAQAQAELAMVAELLGAMRSARDRLTDADVRGALIASSASNGGGALGKQVGEAFLAFQAGVRAFTEREIVLRDLDRGLIDFPALRDGREVYLCWIEGEDDIGFWHELDAGYAGRQAL
jgi:hypothetical protein